MKLTLKVDFEAEVWGYRKDDTKGDKVNVLLFKHSEEDIINEIAYI